ncbi:MAG TPA: hypothetical protein EYH57_05185 [Sulfurovum sp.]|nr:hypothetical protein [Sulfurovum sp.]
MKSYISLAIVAAFAFTGCTNTLDSLTSSNTGTASKNYTQGTVAYDNAPEYKVNLFKQEQRKVGLLTKKDANYKSFAPVLTSEESKRWFNNNMYLLWDRQITKQQYVAKGTSKLPNYRYEFNFIANNF